jgi:hypothetical protein
MSRKIGGRVRYLICTPCSHVYDMHMHDLFQPVLIKLMFPTKSVRGFVHTSCAQHQLCHYDQTVNVGPGGRMPCDESGSAVVILAPGV